jgi:DNA processing protein
MAYAPAGTMSAGVQPSERACTLALALTREVGPRRFWLLRERFGSACATLRADDAELRCVPGIGPVLAQQIRSSDPRAASRLEAGWALAGIRAITHLDPEFPAQVNDIPDPPPLLFLRGRLLERDRWAIAVVGSRAASEESIVLTGELTRRLCQSGYALVSGAARGVDRAALDAALSVRGRAIAVLGRGLTLATPGRRLPRLERVCGDMALMSERLPGSPPSGPSLMTRNRLVTGLAQAVVVVEALADSGSLDAGLRALEQGRPLVVADLTAPGNRQLLAQGAVRIAPDLGNWDELATALPEARPHDGSQLRLMERRTRA